MAEVTGYTKEAMDAMRDGTIVSAEVVAGRLILTKFDGSIQDAGAVAGPVGPAGPAGPSSIIICTSATRPGAPAEGQEIYETDSKRYLSWSGTRWNRIGSSTPSVRTGCRVRRTTNFTVPNGPGGYAVVWNTADEDSDNYFTNGSSIVTVPALSAAKGDLGGLYIVRGYLRWDAAGAAAGAFLVLTVNGFPKERHEAQANVGYLTHQFASPVRLAAGDQLTLSVAQSSGADITVIPVTETVATVDPASPVLEMWRMAG